MPANLNWVPECPAGRLAVMPKPVAGDLERWQAQGVQVVVSLLTLSEELELSLEDEVSRCATLGIEFVSFPIADRGVPDSAQSAARLIALIHERLKLGKSVVIHCRLGVGRTGMMTACVLASLGVHLNEAFEAISQARGLTVPDTAEQRQWCEKFTCNMADES